MAHLPRRGLRRGGIALAVAATLGALAASIQGGSFVYLLYVGSSLVLAAIAWTTLVWTLYAWRTPSSLAGSRLARNNVAPAHSFSLIVPARHELDQARHDVAEAERLARSSGVEFGRSYRAVEIEWFDRPEWRALHDQLREILGSGRILG